MSTEKLTKAQRDALNWALEDGSLETVGLDARPVRRDVAYRLYERGLLSWAPSGMDLAGSHELWRITPTGRAALSPLRASPARGSSRRLEAHENLPNREDRR